MTDTIQGLEVRRVALTALQEDPANARTHGPRNLDAIRGSLARFGQVEPLVVQAGTLRVIAGHGRIAALRELGHEDVDIVEVDVDDLQATALAIALNRSGELAEWDMATLGRLLEGLRSEDAIEGLGFDDAEIDEILGDLIAAEPVDVDDPGPQEPPESPVTQLGDLWLLGGHRILCGDSTLPETYTRLLAGETASREGLCSRGRARRAPGGRLPGPAGERDGDGDGAVARDVSAEVPVLRAGRRRAGVRDRAVAEYVRADASLRSETREQLLQLVFEWNETIVAAEVELGLPVGHEEPGGGQ